MVKASALAPEPPMSMERSKRQQRVSRYNPYPALALGLREQRREVGALERRRISTLVGVVVALGIAL
jgi:hypothetical protein